MIASVTAPGATAVNGFHPPTWTTFIAFDAHIPGMWPLTIHILVAYLILYSIAFWLSVFGWWREVLALWIARTFLPRRSSSTSSPISPISLMRCMSARQVSLAR